MGHERLEEGDLCFCLILAIKCIKLLWMLHAKNSWKMPHIEFTTDVYEKEKKNNDSRKNKHYPPPHCTNQK